MRYVGSYATNDTKFTGTTAHWQLHIQNLLHFDCENISYTNTVVPDDFTVSISTSSASILAGQMFNLTCTVRTVEGLQNVPTVEWLDETGTRVTTGGDTIVGSAITSGFMTTLALVFSPLRVSHGGEFTCRANITSPAPPLQLTKSAEWDLIVDSEYLQTCHTCVISIENKCLYLFDVTYNGSLLCFVHVAMHFWHCMLLLIINNHLVSHLQDL